MLSADSVWPCDTIHTNIQIHGPKIDAHVVVIHSGNNHNNFQLHRFTKKENIGKFKGGATFFDSLCI